jgi:predicted membrane protein (TIGR00267 family)
MSIGEQILLFIRITRSQQIARRYFIVNGFDGTLTMLGLLTGFYVSGQVVLPVAISVCLGAAIALGMSGLTSAYISEAAERKHELKNLEQAMIADLGESAYGKATRFMPFYIALINGLAPFLIALIIITPLVIGNLHPQILPKPLETAALLAFLITFLLGIFLGRISGHFWLWSGMRTLIIAIITSAMIYVFSPAYI